ncbi:MAG: hypothetical protein QGI68_17385 [Pseudomonadales bacterium]|jgi:hypothetical protein|nr:hypothetical protein [Pseudomonadales bacterium]MDP7597318.1 hypothetical protein [Pseudomonadales bacterium]HJN49809.1 hypothetical protein [Pseudomonadales bacterium]
MKNMLKLGASFSFVLSLLGCQLFGGPSDEALLSEYLVTFQEKLSARDVSCRS